MPEKLVKTDHFQSGQQTNARGTKEPMTLKWRMSQERNIGQPDPLRQALTKPPPLIPADEHKWNHSKTPQRTGARYTPMGEFGKPTGKMHSKATDYRSHSSRPGGNPLGNAPNARGVNAMGNNSNRHGSNPLGSYSGKRGDNPLGRNLNRAGQKSGYPNSRPLGGGGGKGA